MNQAKASWDAGARRVLYNRIPVPWAPRGEMTARAMRCRWCGAASRCDDARQARRADAEGPTGFIATPVATGLVLAHDGSEVAPRAAGREEHELSIPATQANLGV